MTYDYVSWNPLWNGKWDRKLAEERFEKYLGKGAEFNETIKQLGAKK
jgi:ribosomal protein S16